MSGCDAFLDLLQEDLDGRLDGASRAALEAHVATCESCARVRARLRRVRAGLRAMAPVAAPAGFREDVLARLPQRGRLLRLPWFSLGAVAAAAVVVVAVTLSQQDSRSAELARSEADAAPPAEGLVGTASRVAGEWQEKERAGRLAKKALTVEAAEEDADAAKPAGTKQEEKAEGAPKGPVGEIPAESRDPSDPPPPATAAGPATPGGAAPKAPPTPTVTPAAERVPEVAETAAAPRVRLAVFRTRADADAFVAALSARVDEAAPPAEPAAADAAPAKRETPKLDGEKSAETRRSAAYAEVARVGLPDAASLARAERAITSSGGFLSEPLDDAVARALADDALLSEELARAVADRLNTAAAAAAAGGGDAGGGAAPGDAKDGDGTARGGTGGGGKAGAGKPSGFGARGPAPKPGVKPAAESGAPPAEPKDGDDAMKRRAAEPPKDKAEVPPGAATPAPARKEVAPSDGEILVVVVVPERPPAPAPQPPR